MAWFDASNYFLLELTTRDHMHELEATAEAVTDERVPLTRRDSPRRIDRIIDYFGESVHRAPQAFGSARCATRS